MNLFKKLFPKKNKARTVLVLDADGKNTLGGAPVAGLVMPKLETSPVVYLGYISKEESHFPSLDFDLHLMCPIFLDIQSPVFLDYSNPMAPVIIRDHVSTNFSALFDDIPYDAIIQYSSQRFSIDSRTPVDIKVGVHDLEVIEGEIGHVAPPNWIQDELVPICPKIGHRMQFLFQLSDIEECETIAGQEFLDKEYMESYMTFGHGFLYVFYEPSSMVVAFVNQT